jgi:thioesterase domain-containing protein/acyl carrier protein
LLNGFLVKIYFSEDNLSTIFEVVRDKELGIVKLTPAHLRMLSDEELCNTSISSFIVGGEELCSDLVSKIDSNIAIYNEYGPTESTVGCMIYRYNSSKDKRKSVPIGKGSDNHDIYILDQNQNVLPIGVQGELHVSGEGLAKGYLNNPELTEEKFIDHPFNEGKKIYRTGDLAKWLSDGNIEFLGRIDDQVKIRGFRIELGEIESSLSKHEKVRESIVLAREENGDKFLCAYLVCEGDLSYKELHTYLSERLPDYMIPSYFVELETIPLTTNGKVNRKILPSPEIKAGDDFVAPLNETESKLIEIWSEVLNIEKEEISTTANFFSIGGHSLKASFCLNKLINSFNINIPLIEIFRNPTVSQLANFIELNKLKISIEDDHLVLLKEGDVSGLNIFFIHDGSGEVDGYIEFCKESNDEFNYWGIKAGVFKKNEPSNFTLEQLADIYIKCLKKVQPTGKYNIAGWSLGGTIAFEMVRQLEQEKNEVRFFGIIDSVPPNINANVKVKEFTVDSELNWLRKYFDEEEVIERFSAELNLKDLWHKVIHYLNNQDGASEIIKDEIVRNIGFNINKYKKASIEDLIKYMNFTRSLSTACSYYIPKNVINSQINYFAARDSKRIRKENWNIFTEINMVIKEIKGDHFSIFTAPNVKFLFKQFKESLNDVNKKVLSAIK